MAKHEISSHGIRTTIYHGLEGLSALRDGWSCILEGVSRRRFYHLWEWYYSLVSCFQEFASLRFYLFAKDAFPLAIFPLQRAAPFAKNLPCTAVSLPSHSHMLLCDVICRDDALDLPLFRHFCEHLRERCERWDAMRLPHLPEDAAALRLAAASPGIHFLLQSEGRCNYTDTTGSYEKLISGIAGRFRKSIKRDRDSLNRLPGADFQFTRSMPELESRLDQLMEVEASGWKGASGAGTAIKLNPDLRRFYRTLTRLLGPSGGVAVNTLSAGGKCMAAQFCILADATWYMLKIGYDESCRRYGPGKLLLDSFIRECMEDGAIDGINYITDARWHADWRPEAFEKVTLYVFNATAAGIAGLTAVTAYELARKMYQRYLKPRLAGADRDRVRRLAASLHGSR